MPNYDLRGKCKEYATALVEKDPSLTLTRGWYHDPVWGAQEHWWTVSADGVIVDPTAEQFPVGGVAALYEEFRGVYPCMSCGEPVEEPDLYAGCCCSGTCYGRMVGVL